MRIADLQIGSSETKIENVNGNIKFTDKTNSSGKLISEITPSINRYTDPDEYTYIHWKLDEESAPYANSGVAGTLNLTVYNGTAQTYRFSPFGNGNCIFFNNLCLSTGNTSVAPGNIYTINIWYYPKAQTINYGILLTKSYRQIGSSWSSPYATIYCGVRSTDFNYVTILTTGGTFIERTSTGVKTLIPRRWNMITVTYDGANIRTYINGNLSDIAAKSGDVDYGTNGPWDLGNKTVGGYNEYVIGAISDIRIETTVRSDSYILNMYKKAMGY